MLQMMTGNNVLGGNTGGMNPLMLMMLSGKEGGEGNDMFSLLAMSQMMGGGSNPLQGLTNPVKPAAPATPAAPAFDAAAFVENLKKNPDLAKQIKDALNAE